MTGQRRPMGWAVLVGVLCAMMLVGLSLVRGTSAMSGVAHSERGPSSASVGTSTTVASPTSDPDPSDVALAGSSPRGSSRGPVGLVAAQPVPVPATPAVVAPVPLAVASGVVRQGAFCARAAVGQIGYTSSGTKMICSYGGGEAQPRWRADGAEQPGKSEKPEKSEKPAKSEQPDEPEQPDTPESTKAQPTSANAPNIEPFEVEGSSRQDSS